MRNRKRSLLIILRNWKNIRYFGRNILGSSPRLFGVLHFVPEFKRLTTTRDSDLVVEGFPRCANSFAVKLFLSWNPGLKVAHHLHVPMQILKGFEYGVPCIVLIREPLEAISSLLIIDLSLSCDLAIRSYIMFYKPLLSFSDNIIISDFPTTTSAFDKVIKNANRKFNRSFHSERITEQMTDAVFSELDAHHKRKRNSPKNLSAIPSSEKEEAKSQIRTLVQQNRYFSEAYELYLKFVGKDA